MGCPCETRTSTCRSFATISSGLYRFLAITVLLDVKDIPQVGPLQWGRISHGIDSEQRIERHRLAFVFVLETGDVGIDELALAGDQHDRAGKLAVHDVLLERIMDAVELLLGHSHLLGWNLWQAHTHERGRDRRQALILRPRSRPTDRSDERESASEPGADNRAIHYRLLPRPVLAPASYRTAREASLLCCASLPPSSCNGRAARNDPNPSVQTFTRPRSHIGHSRAVGLERRRLELPVQPRDPRPRDLVSLVRSKLRLNDLIERVPIESSSSRLPTGTRAERSFRFLISEIPYFISGDAGPTGIGGRRVSVDAGGSGRSRSGIRLRAENTPLSCSAVGGCCGAPISSGGSALGDRGSTAATG